jgi:hypothetical protein
MKLPLLSTVPGKDTTNKIRELIPQMVNDQNAQEIMDGFIPQGPEEIANHNLAFYKKAMQNKKKWRRMLKQKDWSNPDRIERIFDHTDFDDQLRLYVWTDKNDEQILDYGFATE